MEIVETSLYKELEGRKDEAASYYRPFLDICKNDIAPFLENIKRLFPEYPDHGMGHSVRILQYLGTIMNEQMKAFLTSMDLLILIFACLFHDSGMALINANEEEAEDIRKRHPEHAEEVICKYFDAYFKNMHEKERVVRAIVFVCKAHGYSLDELLSSEEFDLEDSIKFSEIHYGVLAFLLRIGDLLDIEDERSNSFRMLMFSESFNQLSKEHNLRHLKLKNYVHRADRLEIKVKADNVTQYKIWHEWFEYLKMYF